MTNPKLTESDRRTCRWGHQIDPTVNRCRHGGHLPKDKDLWAEDLRIGFLDIETDYVRAADAGTVFSWCVKPLGKPVISACINKADLEKDLDRPDNRILKEFVEIAKQFDVFVTYYGTRFDLPFLRTRCLEQGIRFPYVGDIHSWDLYYVARHRLKLSRNRMDNVADLFGVEGKNHVHPRIWRRARYGDIESLKYILDHNQRDVVVLEKCYTKLEGQWRKTKRSI